jgi:hypothetical protein
MKRLRCEVGKMKAVFKGSIIIVILWYSIAGVIPAFGSALKCGVRLITEGDTKSKVLAECGEPENIEVWEEERTFRYFPWPTYGYNPYDDGQYREPRYAREYVQVEEWTYNHGPHRFMDHVRFENGRVKDIISGDYGY